MDQQEKLFNDFMELKQEFMDMTHKIQRIAAIVQNPGIKCQQKQYEEWLSYYCETIRHSQTLTETLLYLTEVVNKFIEIEEVSIISEFNLWWECQCGNRGLHGHSLEDRPMTCHPKCNNPDWKLMKEQKSYIVGKEDWYCEEGEI